jgi:arsenite methyltransferase
MVARVQRVRGGELAGVPEETIRMALGVGNPVRHAGLRPGQDVVDLGSGGGIDCLLAARAVGASGSVVGVDFLVDTVARATRAAAETE